MVSRRPRLGLLTALLAFTPAATLTALAHAETIAMHVEATTAHSLSPSLSPSPSPSSASVASLTAEQPSPLDPARRVRLVDIHRSLTYSLPTRRWAALQQDDPDSATVSGEPCLKEHPGALCHPTPTPSNDPDDVVTFWPNFFAKLMSTLYALLCALSWVQLTRTIVHKHKIKSFRFGFLLVCFLWTLLRVIFWFWVDLHSWPTWLSDIIYFLPNACQITTFSLLILFYAKLVHGHRWRLLRLRFLGFCVLSNVAMVFLTLIFSILMDRVAQTENDDPTSEGAQNVKEFVNKLYFIFSAVFFGVLVLLAAFYIRRIQRSRSSTAGTSKQEVLVTSCIFLIFLSRCIWDLLAAFDANSTLFRHSIWETTTSHVKLMNLATFLLLFIWEIVPTVMVIFYFRHVPHTSDSYCVGFWSCCQTHPRIRQCLSAWPCLFPHEYFETSENSLSAPSHDAASEEEEGRGQMMAPDYERMEDEASGGASSNPLPPGNFVRSTSLSHSQHYVATGSVYGRSFPSGSFLGVGVGGVGIVGSNGMQIVPAKGAGAGLVGSLAGGVHLGPGGHTGTDMYGSPSHTWLNPNHPALSQLNGSAAAAAAAGAHQPQQVHYHPHSSHARHTSFDDEEDDAHYGAHPYVAQQEVTRLNVQQPPPAQQAQESATAASQQNSRFAVSNRRADL